MLTKLIENIKIKRAGYYFFMKKTVCIRQNIGSDSISFLQVIAEKKYLLENFSIMKKQGKFRKGIRLDTFIINYIFQTFYLHFKT